MFLLLNFKKNIFRIVLILVLALKKILKNIKVYQSYFLFWSQQLLF